MIKTHMMATQPKVGPGSYAKDHNLNLLGQVNKSQSKKGFGVGFVSKADRGLSKEHTLQTFYKRC
mgnify:CR=1 FL=1